MNKDIEKIIKLQNRISDRFHLCVHTDLEKELRWLLFINFRDERDYFSSYNIPILDSSRSSIEELEDYLKNTIANIRIRRINNDTYINNISNDNYCLEYIFYCNSYGRWSTYDIFTR